MKTLCTVALWIIVTLPSWAAPFRVVLYGDSNTYGWKPQPNPPSARYDENERWAGILKHLLGTDYEIIEEGLDGRTTDVPDPTSPISGAQLDGAAYLPACLSSHLPVDLVVIMLGTNDLKAVFNRTPFRIALGAGHLIDLTNTLNGGVGTTYSNPKILLICPPPLDEKIKEGPIFGPMFKGGVEKSRQLAPLYKEIAAAGGAEFLDAGSVMNTDGIDGLHFSEDAQEKLAAAIAEKVKPIRQTSK
jgi:lysophospholipase L1-like esterase